MRHLIKYIAGAILSLSIIQSYAQESSDSISLKFELGEVIVNCNRLGGENRIDAEAIERNEKQSISEALNLVPGVISVAGSKEHMVYVRGFNQRQVPVYFDGIPISLPYDGFLDLDMLMPAKISQISVVSGTESLMYGANSLGGAINIVSSKPKKGFNGTIKAGTMTNGKYNGMGSFEYSNEKIYTRVSLSILNRNNYRLSNNYKPTSSLQGKGDLDNSYKKNSQLNIKVGLTPSANNEYAFSYVYNTGEKGIPPYLGINGSARYWQFPDYTTQSLYFISKNKLSENLSVKSRWYYTKFDDCLESYDDSTYTTQNKAYSFTDFYDDYSTGGIATLTHIKENNSIKFDAQYKYDSHSEYSEGEEPAEILDQSLSLSLVESYSWNKLGMHCGVSMQYQDGLKAEYFNSSNELAEHSVNSNLVYNGEIGFKYRISNNNEISGGISYKTRFPTMKDRYSLRLGKSIANPELKEENAINYDLNYSTIIYEKLQLTAGIFYSNLSDAITSVYGVDTSNLQIYQLQNTAKAEYLGGEISISYPILKELIIQGNYAYVKRNNISDPDVKFTSVPENSAQASLIYHFMKECYVNINFEIYSDRYATSDGFKLDGYSLLNTKGAYAFLKNRIVLEAGINNIFDKNYEVSDGYPMMGRNGYTSIIVNF